MQVSDSNDKKRAMVLQTVPVMTLSSLRVPPTRMLTNSYLERPRTNHRFNGLHSIAVVPSSVTPVDHRAWLAVADENNYRVQVMTQLGQPIRIFAADAANGLSPLSNALYGITVCLGADGQAEILVADSYNHRVVGFALDGSAARVVCGTFKEGSGAGELKLPTGLVVTSAGDLWVADMGNHRVCLFR
jgi:hypothetical protein